MGEPRLSTPAWLMDFTANAAETFVTAYYAASDSPQRTQLLPTLYLPTSSIAWNGNPISGSSQYAAFLDAQPGSKHEVQSFDCHPLSSSSGMYAKGRAKRGASTLCFTPGQYRMLLQGLGAAETPS